MRFQLKTSGNFYDNKEKREKLEALGFEFEPSEHRGFIISDKEVFIDIENLKALVDFSNTHGEIIIFGDDLEIYDNCKE